VLINWFTVGAQLVNFLVLVWLMKRFLYKPILGAIDAREKRMASQVADLGQRQSLLQTSADEFKQRSEAFDKERGALLAQAASDASSERERKQQAVRRDAEILRRSQEQAARDDAVALSDEMTRLATSEIFAIVRKTLKELASADLEERVGEMFTRRLRQLDDGAKEVLGVALRSPDAKAVLRTYFDLPARERVTVQNALNETFGADISLRFETAPETICGIELTAGGQKLAWDIGEYLRAFEQKVVALPSRRKPPDGDAATVVGLVPIGTT
jgi:F-type H+-transporting ATPase subunit b